MCQSYLTTRVQPSSFEPRWLVEVVSNWRLQYSCRSPQDNFYAALALSKLRPLKALVQG